MNRPQETRAAAVESLITTIDQVASDAAAPDQAEAADQAVRAIAEHILVLAIAHPDLPTTPPGA